MREIALIIHLFKYIVYLTCYYIRKYDENRVQFPRAFTTAQVDSIDTHRVVVGGGKKSYAYFHCTHSESSSSWRALERLRMSCVQFWWWIFHTYLYRRLSEMEMLNDCNVHKYLPVCCHFSSPSKWIGGVALPYLDTARPRPNGAPA